MNNEPEYEFREDRYWIKGIPRDWPLKDVPKIDTPSICSSVAMTQKQWDNMAGEILDDYNAGKISKELMVSSLQDLKKAKIK